MPPVTSRGGLAGHGAVGGKGQVLAGVDGGPGSGAKTVALSEQLTVPRASSSLRSTSMTQASISAGVVHAVPRDLRDVIVTDQAALAKWDGITPLARNEWICWIESVKRPEMRRKHIERARTELKEGK